MYNYMQRLRQVIGMAQGGPVIGLAMPGSDRSGERILEELARGDQTYRPSGPPVYSGLAPGHIRGSGDGMSDSIPAQIDGRKPAALADGEFVVPADAVSHLGNGSTDAGVRRLHQMVAGLRAARTGSAQQAPQINPQRYLP